MEYKTKQRKILLDFLNSHLDQKFTAKMIFEGLVEPISLSAIYRNLSKLEEEGLLKRFSTKGDSEIFYQYISSKCCENIFHFSCTKCKSTFHLEEDLTKKLEQVFVEQNFLIDKNKTIFYGICQNCRN